MKIWTFVSIDWDLLRDDLDSAESIGPCHAWTTMEQAMDAADRMWQEEQENLGEDWEPLAWTIEGDTAKASFDIDYTIEVYPMTLEPGPATLELNGLSVPGMLG